ncbi:MAG: hypothetical protein PHS75_10535, partial [Anaerolineaceae bacterium]|nr:hypothetical protein [Anaerolineaceae bacterium]
MTHFDDLTFGGAVQQLRPGQVGNFGVGCWIIFFEFFKAFERFLFDVIGGSSNELFTIQED